MQPDNAKIAAVKKFFLGSRSKNGLLLSTFIYLMLISLGFIYLYPILHMTVTSLKSLPDLLDAAVQWIPTQISFENYIVSTHDLVSTTPLDFWCVSIFSVAVTKIIKIKIHCINLFYPIYLFKVVKVCQNNVCVKTLQLRV